MFFAPPFFMVSQVKQNKRNKSWFSVTSLLRIKCPSYTSKYFLALSLPMWTGTEEDFSVFITTLMGNQQLSIVSHDQVKGSVMVIHARAQQKTQNSTFKEKTAKTMCYIFHVEKGQILDWSRAVAGEWFRVLLAKERCLDHSKESVT